MFAEGGSAAGLANAVRVVGLDGRTGFAFRQQLRQRLGDPGPDAPYLLEAELEYADRALDISPDADITRYDVIGLVRYRLLGEGGTELDAGELTAFSAYSTLANPYATEIAERDAERRVARELANRVFGRLAAALARA
jgi:LPS-assembly lipoprotein